MAARPSAATAISQVHLVVHVHAWAKDVSAGHLYVPLSWQPTAPIAAGLTVSYEVQYKVGHPLDGLGWDTGWTPFIDGSSSTHARLSQATADRVVYTGDKYAFRVRAVDVATAEPGLWSTAVVSSIPMDDNWHHQTWQSGIGDIRFSKKWHTTHAAGDFFGAAHTTTKRTIAVLDDTLAGEWLRIFGTKCPSCGKFTVSIDPFPHHGKTPKTITVNTHAKKAEHGVLLYSQKIPGKLIGSAEITTLATHGRPRVTIDAYGVGH